MHISHVDTKNINMFTQGLGINKIHNFYCFKEDFKVFVLHCECMGVKNTMTATALIHAKVTIT